MRVLIEGELQIAVHDAIRTWKFDDSSHGLSHCMKSRPAEYLLRTIETGSFPNTQSLDLTTEGVPNEKVSNLQRFSPH